ncbi:MAG: hypothetical protein KAH56_00830 [Candidatus Krumholzibacteria bacterium]|nr:hypothetical protein [Candidatus Krumholzibacteria bacterium]
MPLQSKLGMLALGSALVCLLGAGSVMAQTPEMVQTPESERMSWLMNRGGLEELALTGQRFEQGEIGGGGGADLEVQEFQSSSKRKKSGWPVLFSLILPGAGEASMGYTRGYFMMAADIFAWTQVVKYHGDGGDLKDEYIVYADDHYSDEMLLEGYLDGGFDPERSGEGDQYFAFALEHNFNTVDDLINLPLYVTKEDDFREYYENLGKWDQFIFGWDDYTRASIAYPDIGYEPTGERADLQHPWVSRHRDIYREMRDASNDAYKSRDRWLYVNIGLRVFSVLQSAYLSGVLGGDSGEELKVAGHTVQVIAQPAGFNKGALTAIVSF